MRKNVGNIDRLIRALVSLSILVLYLTHQIHGGEAAFLGIVALVFLFTSVTSFCPCYARLNVNTGKNNVKNTENIDNSKNAE